MGHFQSTPVPLDHAVRRRIVRCLHRRERKLSSEELATELRASISSVDYHADVLARSGMISPNSGAAKDRRWSSTVSASAPVLELLKASQAADEAW